MRTPYTLCFTLQSGGIRLYPLPTAWDNLAVATALVEEVAGSGGRVGSGDGGVGRGRKEEAYIQVGAVVSCVEAVTTVNCTALSAARFSPVMLSLGRTNQHNI